MNPPKEHSIPSRKLNILFVDDDPAFSKPIGVYLHNQFGHNTKLANSAEQAYKEVQRSNFDIIILDYKLTDASGLDVLRWLSENKIDTPVIVVTGYGTEEVAVDAMKLGAYDYVNKGHISLDYVPVLIHDSVERFRAAKQQRQKTTALQAFQNAVHSSLFLISKSLSHIQTTLVTLRNQPLAEGSVRNPEEFDSLIVELERETHVIRETVNSLNDLNDLLSQQYSFDQGISTQQRNVQQPPQQKNN